MQPIDNNLFRVENLVFSYALGTQTYEALRGITIDIPSHSLVTFTGPSGSGKSTLLNILGLIEPMQKGKIFFLDKDISHLSERQKNKIRKYKIGFIFQQFYLIPVLSAKENVEYFLKKQHLGFSETHKRTKECLESVGLWAKRHKKPSELSGGEQQRVAIARALAKKPEVIIADEPTANLDQKTSREIMDLLLHMVKEKNVSIIISTHDPMVQSFAEHNFKIHDGQVIQ